MRRMLELRLFGFGLEVSSSDKVYDVHGYTKTPLRIQHPDLSHLRKRLDEDAPKLFKPGITLGYEIWECVGTVPVRALDDIGTITGTSS